MRTFAIIGAGLSLLVVTGCNQGGGYVPPKESTVVKKVDLQPGQEKSLWPMKVGTQWTYETNDTISGPQNRSSSNEITLKVANLTEIPGGMRANVDVLVKDKVEDKNIWQITTEGISQVAGSGGTSTYEPPFKLVPFPVKEGDTFSFTGMGPAPLYANASSRGTKLQQRVNGKVLGFMEVDTGMGPMRALAVEQTNAYTHQGTDFTSRTTSWWVPTVGLVRFVQEATGGGVTYRQTLRLKSHTAK
ncbi:MAG: hypothetical protein MUC92_06475 [Fimbriimonadaceae bacterium]|jgi:hypothetical protein|nr:hypothetical protein [Fimbriimonadaceae bacterium]